MEIKKYTPYLRYHKTHNLFTLEIVPNGNTIRKDFARSPSYFTIIRFILLSCSAKNNLSYFCIEFYERKKLYQKTVINATPFGWDFSLSPRRLVYSFSMGIFLYIHFRTFKLWPWTRSHLRTQVSSCLHHPLPYRSQTTCSQ